ncbi:MAG: TetR family transcriptional regulator [Acidimicrobiia bacterium]|nr:TetR family transcriptional regulator [Acidimicrobiia bacterium]
MAAGGTLRERHADRTRQRIVEAARGLFVDQGYDATTVDEIAAGADISPRTFFRYFATKDALLFHDFEERLERIRERIEARPAGEGAADTLVHVLGEVVADLETTPEERALVRRLVEERPSIRSYQRSAIAEHGEQEITAALAQRAGLAPDDIGLRSMIAAVGACFDIALREWFARAGGRRSGAGETFDGLFAGVLEACAAAFPARRR